MSFQGTDYENKFLSDLVDFVANNKFQSMFESFFIEHATKFSADEEHQLHYTEIYQKFHKMFEGQLDTFCDKKNISQADFMQKCRAARDNDPKAKHYIDILLSSVEYETFVKLMRIMRPVAESRLSSMSDAKKSSSAGASESSEAGYGDDVADAKRSPGGSTAPAKSSKGQADDDDDDGFGGGSSGGGASSAAGSKGGGYADDDDSPDAKMSRMGGTADSKDGAGSK